MASIAKAAPTKRNTASPLPSTTTTLAITYNGKSYPRLPATLAISLSATVSSGTAPVTVGQVIFCDASAKFCDSTHILGIAQLNSSGTASVKFIPSPGVDSYKAIFNGTVSYSTSTSSVGTLTVYSTASSQTTLNITGSAGNYSATATVTGIGSGPAAPSGPISIIDTTEGGASIGAATLIPGTPTLTGLPSESLPLAGGAAPVVLGSGDFNGDGTVDLVVGTRSSPPSVSVWFGDIYGTFQASSSSYPVDSLGPAFVSDFNCDGKLDIAVARANPSSLNIFLGNGDGTFTVSQTTLQRESDPVAIVGGDFNHDGYEDLVVANSDTGDLTVYLGNGDGTFTSSTVPSTIGPEPVSMAAGDFDGDGILDLAVGNDAGALLILRGVGDGTFVSGSTITTNYPFISPVVGDLNGDGKLDIVSSAGPFPQLTILLGNGDGTFTYNTLTTSNQQSGVALNDMNRDGIPDIITTSDLTTNTSVFLGIGDGTFSTSPSTFFTYLNPAGLVVADFNGDGVPDIATASSTSRALQFVWTSLVQRSTGNATGISVHGGGQHAVAASFPGDNIFHSSTSNTQNVVATPGPPSITIKSASVNITTAQNLSVGITVTGGPADPAPTGTVQLTSSSYISSIVGLGSGTATINIPAGSLAAGLDNLNVVYTPDSTGATVYTSASGSTGVAVTQSAPSMTVKPASANITTVQNLSVGITVTGVSTGPAPTGTVQLASGSYTSSAVALGNGIATINIPAGSLAAGVDNLNVVYTPDTAGAAVYTTARGTVSVTVTQGALASTTTTFVLSNNNLTFAATVSSATAGTPTGQVSFYAGSTVLGTATLNAGTATYTATAFPAGDVMLTAVYAGDTLFAGSTSTAIAVLAVTPASNTLTVSSASSVQDVLTLSVPTGYVGAVQVTCSGLPQYATCYLSPTSVTFSGSTNSFTTTLTINTGSTASASPAMSPFGPQGRGPWLAALGIPGLLGIAFANHKRRRIRTIAASCAMFAAFATLCAAISGCAGSGGGGGSSSTTTSTNTSTPTPTGTYSVQVTTTAGSAFSQTTTLSLKVQ